MKKEFTFPILLILIAFTIVSCTKEQTICTTCSVNSNPTTLVLTELDDAHVGYKASNPANANTNSGNAPEIPIYSWTVLGDQVNGRVFMRFPLDSIPVGSQIISAKLSLYGLPPNYPSFAIPQGNAGDNILVIQRVTSAWNESTVTWNTQPTSTAIDEVQVPASNSTWDYHLKDVDITPIISQSFSSNNFGFVIKLQTEQNYRSFGFLSSEYVNVGKRPILHLTYSN